MRTSVKSATACQFCLLGAIHKVYPNAELWGDLEERIADAIKAVYPGELDRWEGLSEINDVASWNDAPSTTFTKVRNVIRKARI